MEAYLTCEGQHKLQISRAATILFVCGFKIMILVRVGEIRSWGWNRLGRVGVWARVRIGIGLGVRKGWE